MFLKKDINCIWFEKSVWKIIAVAIQKILNKAAIQQEQQKGLTDSEKELIKAADNKEWENVDDNK